MDYTKMTAVTLSGSEYTVIRRGDAWFLRGTHSPTPLSSDVNGTEWPIERPDIPRVGERWIIYSLHVLDPSHPDRMPGGGKVTSPVVSVTLDTTPVTD